MDWWKANDPARSLKLGYLLFDNQLQSEFYFHYCNLYYDYRLLSLVPTLQLQWVTHAPPFPCAGVNYNRNPLRPSYILILVFDTPSPTPTPTPDARIAHG
jgi:hypothetical protein